MEVEKEIHKKLPKNLKGIFIEAAKHAKRQGKNIPKNLDGFFEDWYMYMWIYNIKCYGK